MHTKRDLSGSPTASTTLQLVAKAYPKTLRLKGELASRVEQQINKISAKDHSKHQQGIVAGSAGSHLK